MLGTKEDLQRIADRARNLLSLSSDPAGQMKRAVRLLDEDQSELLPPSVDQEDPDQFVADLLLNNPVLPDLLRLRNLRAADVVSADSLEDLLNRLM